WVRDEILECGRKARDEQAAEEEDAPDADVSGARRRQAEKGHEMKKSTFSATVRATGDRPSITINTGGMDRDAEIVEPLGADLTFYRKNPSVLYGHDYSSLPVAVTTAIDVSAHGIQATWRWLENDPFADRVRNAWNQGV